MQYINETTVLATTLAGCQPLFGWRERRASAQLMALKNTFALQSVEASS
jgi:hypothetical protein